MNDVISNNHILKDTADYSLGSLYDHYTFLGNCPPTSPLSQHFAVSEK